MTFQDLPELAGEAVGGAAIAVQRRILRREREPPYARTPPSGASTCTPIAASGWTAGRPGAIGPPMASRRVATATSTTGASCGSACRDGSAASSSTPRSSAATSPTRARSTAPRSTRRSISRELETRDAGYRSCRARSSQGNHRTSSSSRATQRFTHVRLRIFPDGGVARLRVHGEVVPRWDRLRARARRSRGARARCRRRDLQRHVLRLAQQPHQARCRRARWPMAGRRGGVAAPVTSGRSSGSPAPARSSGSRSIPRTSKATRPRAAMVEGGHGLTRRSHRLASAAREDADASRTRATSSIASCAGSATSTHLRLSMYPCGGVARLRAWGSLVGADRCRSREAQHHDAARLPTSLLRCCGSSAWAAAMCGARPFEDEAALLRHRAIARGSRSTRSAHLEAFGAHPKIGEQAAAASTVVAGGAGGRRERRSANPRRARRAQQDLRGEARLHLHRVRHRPHAPSEMLAELRARHDRARADELRTAAEEQAKITRLRLAKLLQEL